MRDLMGLMKQAQAMQQKLADAQSELENLEVEGAAGGGAVTVRMTAKGAMRAIHIDATLLIPDEKEIVEDLVVAAVNDARTRGEKLVQDRMQELTKGLPIPPGMNLF
ncbi:nucleoid-associated protein [Camelimonas fluminis]|uniref:Nucleoid-associated protein ACFONL_00790 n=1 Tax=Camelimonas fluminis TaxID=1576911 RepID=A0ABV7UC21_9HYPH|nr:YbaB/EbfC family nucleoid-associated protein [Camelimonas fluminis]GHE64484.1 nucleoid-associated protein [Camelimonas fluminis]